MKLFTIGFLFATVSTFAQLPDIYQEVVDVPGISKDELYLRAREWFVTAYNDANKVIQMDDKEAGQIIGKGKFSIILSLNTRFVQHIVNIEVKDERYRYTINDLTLDWGDGVHLVPFPDVQKMYHKNLGKQTDEHIRETILSLKKGMQTPRTDW